MTFTQGPLDYQAVPYTVVLLTSCGESVRELDRKLIMSKTDRVLSGTGVGDYCTVQCSMDTVESAAVQNQKR